MILTQPENWIFGSEVDPNKPIVHDDVPGHAYLPNSPGIKFQMISFGIKDVAANEFAIGFIQYLTKYKLDIRYSKGTLSIECPTPISDASVGEKVPDEYTGPDFLTPHNYPFYQPPKKVLANGGTKIREPFTYYTTEVTDGPGFQLSWTHAGDDDNQLRHLARYHVFETWAVIWNLGTKTIEHALYRWTWEHITDGSFDASKPKGDRVQLRHCKNQVIGEVLRPDKALVPPAVLGTPSANEASRDHQKFNQTISLPAAGFRVW